MLFNKEELTERIKYLSTTNINKLEAKGKDRREIEFFGKFILCSNNEVNFIKIDADEIRFWVMKIPSIQNLDVDLLDKLYGEIPAFFHFLLHRTMKVTAPLSRMWFSAKQIETPALRKLIKANRCKIEMELAGLLLSVMDKFDWDEINITPLDAAPLLSHIKIRTTPNDLRDILKRNWHLKPQNNSNAYEKVNQYFGGDFFTTPGRGRFYTVKKEFLLENFDEMMME